MNFLLKNLSAIVITVCLIGGVFGMAYEVEHPVNPQTLTPAMEQAMQTYVQNSEAKPSFGTTQPFAGQTYNLSGAGVSSSASTITLTSLTIKQTGQPIFTTDLTGSAGTFYITIEPGSNTTQEIVGCTAVSQNGTSASLTGCTRGLSPISPYGASTTLAFTHSGGSQVIFSDPPQFFNQYYALANAATSTNILVFSSTTPPHYDADPVWANFTTSILADVSYVNSVVAAGAANGSETVKGIFQLASGSQASVGTSLGNTGARLILGNNLATSSPYSGTPQGSIPSTAITGGKLSQSFWDLTQNFTVSGLWSFLGAETNSASTTFNATTTIAASSTIANALRLNGINYAFPSVQASGILINNGAGVLSWGSAPRYSLITGTNLTSSSGYATSTYSLSIPANTLTGSSTITVFGNAECVGGTSPVCIYYLRDSNTGSTLASCSIAAASTNSSYGSLNMTIANQSSLTSQSSISNCDMKIATTNFFNTISGVQTATVNTANALNLVMVVNINSGSTQLLGVSITVNP